MREFEGLTLAGQYLLEELLGQGAFGAVYSTRQSFLGVPVRRVALKLSKRTNIGAATARELFADAFLLAEALDHIDSAEARSHLVQVFDIGLLPQTEGRAFMVMEFVPGTTLGRQFAAYRRVPGPVLMKWVRQIVSGMAALHRLNPPLIHRDLKPDNILLGGVDRHVRIVDFGLAARALAQGIVPGVAGTMAYMAPETMREYALSVPASDVYSIGILLYEGLTGNHPFEHVSPPVEVSDQAEREWLYAHRKNVRPERPSRLNPSVSARLDEVVMRCLEFDRKNRYQDAGSLLEELDAPATDPGDDQVSQARALKESGAYSEARTLILRMLGDKSIDKKTRFNFYREISEVSSIEGDHKQAARYLECAWELVRNSAILRTLVERACLLEAIEEQYRLVPNEYMANRYREERQRELQGGRS